MMCHTCHTYHVDTLYVRFVITFYFLLCWWIVLLRIISLTLLLICKHDRTEQIIVLDNIITWNNIFTFSLPNVLGVILSELIQSIIVYVLKIVCRCDVDFNQVSLSKWFIIWYTMVFNATFNNISLISWRSALGTGHYLSPGRGQ